jgi:hypothetical protein
MKTEGAISHQKPEGLWGRFGWWFALVALSVAAALLMLPFVLFVSRSISTP